MSLDVMPRSPRLTAGASLVLAALALTHVSGAEVGSADPAARGLDVLVHAPTAAIPRGRLPLQIEAFGFPSATVLAKLGGAEIEAGWDPEQLGPGVSVAPPPVRVTADGNGLAHLEVPVPDGDERELTLLVGVRSGGHARTRSLKVKREALHTVALRVADPRVVPSTSVSAWVLVTQASSGEPAPNAPIEVELLEGGQARHTIRAVTDRAGTAMIRVPIPPVDEPTFRWQLRARSLDGDRVTGHTEISLTPRDDTPGSPRLQASWRDPSVLAGERATFRLRLHDASSRPIARHPLRYWVGPKGTEPPKGDEEWVKASKAAETDADGDFSGSFDAPTLVVAGVGTSLRVVARTTVEGHALEDYAVLTVGAPAAAVTLLPEAGSLVPGVEQRLLLRARDGHDDPVAGATFSVKGDGLDQTVTTGREGEVEVTWKPPVDVGARRDVGPCAGGVAAAVLVRPQGDAKVFKGRSDPFELCLTVDRDAAGLVEVSRPVAHPGEKVHVSVRVPEAKGAKKAPAGPWSMVLRGPEGARATSLWMDDGERGADVEIPRGSSGAWSISLAAPSPQRKARLAGGTLLVVPDPLPALAAKVTGGRPTPGGAVDIDAELTDGRGKGLAGTVALVLVDSRAGGSTEGLERADARRDLCDSFSVGPRRCAAFLEGDASVDPLRRGALGQLQRSPLGPAHDPGGAAHDELRKTFGEVIRSLEGALFEASTSLERIRDVRRRTGRGSTFNPELLTLVTSAMDPQPRTPGGEPISLVDLVAVDPQVTFDKVAARVTRLRLFRILEIVRRFRRDNQLDPGEPLLDKPNVLLRKLVERGDISAEMLLDPWGGAIQFVKSTGAPVPFLSVVHGYELHAPGPDGRLGTADDVKDPFQRVLTSGSPYALAAGEDRIVDSRWDMEVSEGTVSAWSTLLERFTGTSLGDVHGISGVGEGGGGRGEGMGFGSGHGTLGGGRGTGWFSARNAHWAAPQRTDDQGHVRFHVPLGDLETTWRAALVGVPDGGRLATTHVDVPVSLPLSARVEAGVRWTEGDRVDVAVTLRNRTGAPAVVAVTATASGVARLAGEGSRSATVPAGGAAVVTVPVIAGGSGVGQVHVVARAGELTDEVTHSFEVAPAAEPTDMTRAQWVESAATLAVSLGGPKDAPWSRPAGSPRVVLERGFGGAVVAAMDSLDPDHLSTAEPLADAIEVAARVRRFAVARDGDGSALAKRAADIGHRAEGRLSVVRDREADWVARRRAQAFIPPPPGKKHPPAACPPKDWKDAIAALDAEPPPESGTRLSCWDANASSAAASLETDADPVALARAVLALSDRPHRASLAATLAEKLKDRVGLRPNGVIALPAARERDRSARALVYAALLRSARLGPEPLPPGAGEAASAAKTPARVPEELLMAWVYVQRDADGGFGSAEATRAVVAALLASSIGEQGTSTVLVSSGAERREVQVGPDARVEVSLPADATSVQVEVKGPGVLARLERPVLRLWSHPPEAAESPLRVDVTWPSDARAGHGGVVVVTARHTRGRPTDLDLRLPLPPGVGLAAPVDGVRQVLGTLAITRTLDASGLPAQIDLPVRFGLAGAVTVPEGRATVHFEEVPRALVPARPLLIR